MTRSSALIGAGTNWAGNHRFEATGVAQPESLAELQETIAESPRVRAVGSRHSFNAIADTPGVQVDLSQLPSDIRIAEDRSSVSVGAATPYGVLAARLQAAGLALHNLGSLPHISVAGACAVGTHGSGDGNGNLSTAVSGVELVLADGSIRVLNPGDPDFDGCVIGLGLLGVVHRLTLKIQPSYEIRQDVYLGLPWASLLGDLDAITEAGYSVNVFTRWSAEQVTKVWVKTVVDPHDPGTAPSELAGATLAASDTVAHASTKLTNATVGGLPGPWNERLPHFRADAEPSHVDELQTEYLLPRAAAPDAFVAIRAIGHRIDPLLINSEIRTMGADRLWLSPAFRRDTVGLHFTWHNDPPAVLELLRSIEEVLLPFDARPHWGKLFLASAAEIAPLYTRMPDFEALVRRLDPEKKFHNKFADAHILTR